MLRLSCAFILPWRESLGGGATCDGHHPFIRLRDTGGAHATRLKGDAHLQGCAAGACSTCHDGLLAPVARARQGATPWAAVPRRIFPPPPSDNMLINGGLARFLEPLCTHVILRASLVFCFMSDIIEPCISRSFPIALRRQRSCCASRFVTVTRSASAPWPTCPIGSPRAWRPCVGLSGANLIISQVGTLSVGRSLVSSIR